MNSVLDEIAINQIRIDDIIKYSIMATMVPGIEDTVENQLLESFPDCIILCKRRGKIFFAVTTSLRYLLKLKCFDNIYL